MDSLIAAAARALAAGDPLGALKRVALRKDAPALALRGIAMAQIGDLVRAKVLLRRAARAFGPKEAVARARCIVAEAEIALVSRDLSWPAKALDTAQAASGGLFGWFLFGAVVLLLLLRFGQTFGEGGCGCAAIHSAALVRTALIVQQGLRTPTEPSFKNCCTHGIRGLLFGSASTRRSRGRTASFSAVI
jgi:hypothetical protein